MDENEIPRERLDLKDDREVLSPPIVDEPLYACATAVTVLGFAFGAELELEIAGASLPREPAGSPDPDGYAFQGIGPLTATQTVRARQWLNGVASDWSPAVTVRSHVEDFPAGPPRPVINPAPVYECGSRTGVSNLLTGCNVWISADGTEVGRRDGAKEHQGVNVNPDYGLNQRVRAHAEICRDEAPPSVQYITQPPPQPLPTPAIDDAYDGGEQIRITNLVNGARFTIDRGGALVGPYRTWGHAHLVTLSPPLTVGETIAVTQQMCLSDPASDPGKTTVEPCGELPAPVVHPVQVGDDHVRIIEHVVGAQIKIFANSEKIGDGGGQWVQLTRPVGDGETIYVYQQVGNCVGDTVRVAEPLCVAPPLGSNPAAVSLFPVGHWDYADGDIKGSVFYPAEDDGTRRPFFRRLADLGRVPIVFMAHGNHATRYDPNDRTIERSHNCLSAAPAHWPEIPNHKGYDYFQRQLARMGIIAVSVDCNETNGCTSNDLFNIERRADLVAGSIDYFQSLDQNNDEIFGDVIDFSRVGLMGHSRGGEAVVIVGNEVPAKLDVGVRAVISIGPVNHDTYVPDGYAYMAILPASDGDVSSVPGAKFYDQAVPRPLKSQLYIDFANHNYFNREWIRDEDGRPASAVLSRGVQERILSAYGCALYRAFLLNHDTARFLTYRTLPPGIDHRNVHLSFETDAAMTVDDHEQTNGIARNSLDEPTSQSGGVSADEYRLARTGASTYTPNTFYGQTKGMVVECREQNGVFRSQLDRDYDLDTPEYEIWIRTAEVSDGGSNSAGHTGFELGLEDRKGNRAWVDSDDVGGVPRPFDQAPTATKTVLNTLRFPTRCVKTEKPSGRFDKTSVRAILIRCNRSDRRSLAFDVLQIVRG
uniref:Secreted protein n=1 Tax=uncultured bacterium 'pool 3 contig00022' TaxID=1497872 RepID=A0A059V8B9_9BACT|nr:hypothetical protein [uncultured bacterium 'pool 3 contig00022']